MSMYRDLVDAVIEDLNTNAGLPTHNTIPYRRPRAIQPEVCPLLVVWFTTKESNIEEGTTDRFDSLVGIGISWHEETIEEAETLINNPEISTALMDALERIEDRARALSTAGAGVSSVYEVLPGSSAYVPAEMQDGVVEAVVHELVCRTSEV